MPPKKGSKRTAKPPLEPKAPAVTLGNSMSPDMDDLALTSLPASAPTYHSPPPFETTDATQDTIQNIENEEDEEENGAGLAKMGWTMDMKEQLVDALHLVFEEGGAADNSFKKSAFEKAARQVKTVYTGPHEVNWTKCKNQWSDLKAKWAHWKFLALQSGVGFNLDTELYEFYDYVWDSLNRSHPKIIWHKTHIMPFRERIGYILHDVQARGEDALTLEALTPIDPRLQLTDSTRAPSSSSPAPTLLKPGKSYNKSRGKRVPKDEDEEEGTPPPKKVDLGVAISGYTREMQVARRAKEEFLTNQQKAIKLLESKYKNRLGVLEFLRALTWLQIEENAVSFITLDDSTYRDRLLEVSLEFTLSS
jgi:hypothetical protein